MVDTEIRRKIMDGEIFATTHKPIRQWTAREMCDEEIRQSITIRDSMEPPDSVTVSDCVWSQWEAEKNRILAKWGQDKYTYD